MCMSDVPNWTFATIYIIRTIQIMRQYALCWRRIYYVKKMFECQYKYQCPLDKESKQRWLFILVKHTKWRAIFIELCYSFQCLTIVNWFLTYLSTQTHFHPNHYCRRSIIWVSILLWEDLGWSGYISQTGQAYVNGQALWKTVLSSSLNTLNEQI